jgi:hypothetical protein
MSCVSAPASALCKERMVRTVPRIEAAASLL